MQSAKKKLSDMWSACKEHVEICSAKAEEKAEKAVAGTEEEREIAHERMKAKEAKAKMELHEARARHAAEKLRAKRSHVYGGGYTQPQHETPVVSDQQGYNVPVASAQGGGYGHENQPVGSTVAAAPQGTVAPTAAEPIGEVTPTVGIAVPTYPLGGHPPGY